MTRILDALAERWLIHRGRLISLKPRPMRIEFPPNLSAEEAEELRDIWKRLPRKPNLGRPLRVET